MRFLILEQALILFSTCKLLAEVQNLHTVMSIAVEASPGAVSTEERPDQKLDAPSEPEGKEDVAAQNEEEDEEFTTPISTPTEPSMPVPESLSLPLSAADGIIKKPFARPLDTVKPNPSPNLTFEQEKKYNSVLETVSSWTTVPTTLAKNAPAVPITEDERMFLTRECLLRYLRATKWNVSEATARLRATLAWRREYGVEERTSDYVSIENETGKQVIMGYDINSRPCHYLRPSKQNTKRSDRQIQHLVFMLERVIDLMVPGQETLSLLINFKESGSSENAGVGQGRQTLYILQNHYPERLGRALVVNGGFRRRKMKEAVLTPIVPFVLWGFFKLITPFIDPLTREKLKFNEDMRTHVPPTQLLRENGGDVEFEYDHSIYWPALIKMAEQRRREYRERWIRGAKHVGEYEGYLRGGSEKSLAERKGPTVDIDEKVASMAAEAPTSTSTAMEAPDINGLKVY